MTRRTLLSLAAGGALAREKCCVALDAGNASLLRCENEPLASGLSLPPGSAIKPLTWMTLARRTTVHCPGKLTIGGHRLDCTHVPFAGPVDGESALAASCNFWFAEMAKSMDPHLFQQRLLAAGARAVVARTLEVLQLQALGLEGVEFTPMALAGAYVGVAKSDDAILHRGLERAVSEGTAQWAAPRDFAVAGKTGTVGQGAWFAGFGPSSRPRVVVVAYVAGGRGGGDAAPVAREMFEWWRRSSASR